MRVGIFVFVAVQAFLCTTAWAQDRSALQAAALFQQSCVRFAGRPDLLRGWIAAHHLRQVSREQALVFSSGHPALVFSASTQDGKMALISEDGGACRVVVEHGVAANVDDALTTILTENGAAVAVAAKRVRQQPATTQTLYRTSIGARRWLLSVTSHEHDDAPGTPPEIILLATVPAG